MPARWTTTLGEHRDAVRDAVLDAAGALAQERGIRGVTMLQVAQTAGIGRATLYKYFAGVEPILIAWHEREVARHLELLRHVAARPGDELSRLRDVLELFAEISHQHHGSELAALVHQGDHHRHAHGRLEELVRDLVQEAADAGAVRTDADAGELATYCLHALSGARELPTKAAVRRLVGVVLTGLLVAGNSPKS